jgi:hypothetical protein
MGSSQQDQHTEAKLAFRHGVERGVGCLGPHLLLGWEDGVVWPGFWFEDEHAEGWERP